ncbi:Isochorismatase-like protein [Lasiosphaeria hispida]|uniref:Isochorismatase-like protein n=1 Tax=Lasiosphaeria hispida TaxID=260671 RepID=A0AAJ0HA61_9PEZI|nr:Isochorismatase-like protein [Lasiosphaeria hispida]
MPETALFIIDIQTTLATDPATRIPAAARILAATAKILSAARTLPHSALIVIIQHSDPSGPLTHASPSWQLVFPPLHPSELLIHKITRDVFASNPALAGMLRGVGVREVVVCGIQSECCVEATCVGALEAGFGVTLLGGAHSTYDVGGKGVAEVEGEVEGRVRARGGRVVGWEEVVDAWEERGEVFAPRG